ncbi:MAG: SDR family NAD(P)-dependent oxidoreductase [Alphaproteobacteria bacterium]|nr:SDR family NAD(P)-dependent oxidoreductase [Alphaproteobacteria bacterium]
MRDPRSILITGASSGIGEALALHYAAPGSELTLTGRDNERLEAVAAACRAKGAEVLTAPIAVTERESMARLVAESDARRPLDLVIANAGISAGSGDASGIDAIARSLFAVNVEGVFNTVHPALERMAARGSGQIALMASMASFVGLPGAGPYSASKAAVRTYGEALRGRFARKGIRVSVICPGYVRSRLTARNRFPMPFLMDADRAARVIARGLARNRARIAFPWPVLAAMRLLQFLPASWSDHLLRRAPAKD